MLNWLKSLDRVLRGEVTRPEAIESGEIEIPIFGITLVIITLGMVYGACMGTFSLFKAIDPSVGTDSDRWMQLLASTIKIPALFFLTLLVTFPSLYVFNALMGSRLTLPSLLRLLLAALGVNLAVLASLGPIVAFFSVSTTSYNFMKLFNVLVLGLSGVLGLAFLVQTLNRLTRHHVRPSSSPISESKSTDGEDAAANDDADTEEGSAIEESLADPAMADQTPPEEPGALDAIDNQMMGPHVRLVFRLWVLVFGLVGAQMGWVLRPFIGSPEQPFTWFRHRESNFFQELGRILINLLGGN